MTTCEECNGEDGHKHYCSQHPDYVKPETVAVSEGTITEPLQYKPKGENHTWSFVPKNLEFRFAPKE